MRHKRLLILLTSLLMGCTIAPISVGESPGGTQTAAPSPASQTPVVTATASSIKTATPAAPTASPAAIPSPTGMLAAQLKRQCLPIASMLPTDAEVEGLVVLSGYGYTPDYSYLLDVATGREIFLPSNEARDVIKNPHVSPNRKWLAYRDLSSPRLMITAADGQPQQIIPWENSWNLISGWLDNEHLLISRKRGDNLYDSLVVLNPFTEQEEQELLPNYPDILAWYPEPNWYWFDDSKTVYDSNLSRVVYPGLSKDDMVRLFLWDVQASQQVAVITGTLSFGVTPQWSPDGQRFIISGPATLLSPRPQPDPNLEYEELFSVSREGEITRLTHLTDYYSEVRFSEYAWSPDGRYIAFRLDGPESYPDLYPTTQPQVGGRWVVMDVLTQQITDYCLPGGLSVVAPVWSPDSRQVVVEDYYQSTPPFKSNVYLIDITQNFAVQIAEDVTPFGWMKSSP